MLLQSKVFRPRLLENDSICARCLLRLSKGAASIRGRQLNVSSARKGAIAERSTAQGLFRREYFSANEVFTVTRSQLRKAASGRDTTNETSTTTVKSAPAADPLASNKPHKDLTFSEPPHRRRKRLKEDHSISPDTQHVIPPDASSSLSTLSGSLPTLSLRRLLTTWLSLSKPRLTYLMVLTTATAYSLYPVPALLLPTTTISPSLSALTLVFLTAGTALCSASANALNMLLEPEHDAKMSRTRNRPIVRGLIGKQGALLFASVAGALGVGSLWFGVNPTVAFLGGLNIFLYAGVYTPMKRISVINTWIGAVVGGIPPLMGWAAAAGQSATGSGEWRELLLSEESVGGWLLAGLLFAWQFPHFNALSWTIREEYKIAGYRMLAWTNSRMNGRVALRYAVLLFPICIGLWWFQITDQGFLVTSSVVNVWMVREAWRFWRLEGQKGSARGLFWASIWQLPIVMVLAMAHKKGLWEGLWKRVTGEKIDDDGWTDDEEPVGALRGKPRQAPGPNLSTAPAMT